MSALAPSIWERLETLSCRTTLADGPRRVVRCAPPGGGGGHPAVVAKFYRDGDGAPSARTLEVIHAALERSASPFLGVPRVLGYDPRRRVLLQEHVPGVRLDALLAGPDASTALYRAGRALAALHGLAAAVGPARRLRDHLDDLFRPHPTRVGEESPALAARLPAVLDALLAAESRWRPRPRDVPIHRDVHARQLFLDGERVWLVDWDLCARGDGALDLGNFAAWLRARRGAGDEAVGSLLRGYAESGDAGVVARAPLYEALTYVRLCCKRFRRKPAGWRGECADLVARAERCVSREP